jgi:hypothetical protein
METTFTLYGPRAVLAGLAAVILDDAAVESYELHRDAGDAGYAFITLDDGDGDLALDTYEAIETAPGITYEIAHEQAAA